MNYRINENSFHSREGNRTQLFGAEYDDLTRRAASPYDQNRGLDVSQSTLSQLESQNDVHISAMGERIKSLKSLSLRMGDEIKGSKHTLDSLGEAFDNGQVKLKQTFRNMMVMAKNSRISIKTWLIIFLVVFLVFFWVWIR
ncbi:LAMI_0E05512g1_1 [Lachancea mirantina]|uniref:LAMI_0E05512g1_1 n=1 Tax=Lachancea mirantina TaxID=1230905 RepID=A0A1G4JL70_9SACH|nr:LAMI_0E05512g1_1 [Lachancea mirantina]